jgi:hypothetical protein
MGGVGFASSGLLMLILGLPPAPEDSRVTHVAPDECLAYFSWAGVAVPDAKSANQTEQLLAEPELRDFFALIERAVRQGLSKAAQSESPEAVPAIQAVADLVKVVLTHPAAIYLGSIRRAAGAECFQAARLASENNGGRTVAAEQDAR